MKKGSECFERLSMSRKSSMSISLRRPQRRRRTPSALVRGVLRNGVQPKLLVAPRGGVGLPSEFQFLTVFGRRFRDHPMARRPLFGTSEIAKPTWSGLWVPKEIRTSRVLKNPLASLEIKMIGKRYRKNCTYGLMRGNRTVFHGRFYTGTKLETADTAKSRPNER
jgi:hypothetical protein